MPGEIISGMGVSLALGATGVLGSALISQQVKQKLFPNIQQTYLSDTIDFDEVHSDNTTLIGKTGNLTRTYQIIGKDYNICHQDDLIRLTKGRQFFWDRLANEGIYLKVITVRRRVDHPFNATFQQTTLQHLHDKWMAGFKNTYVNHHYLIIEEQAASTPHNGGISPQLSALIARLKNIVISPRKSFSDHGHDHHPSKETNESPELTIRNKSRFEEACHLIETLLSDYGIHLLSNTSPATDSSAIDTDTSSIQSPLLSFWANLINNRPLSIARSHSHIAESLTQCRITFDSDAGLIHYYDGVQTRYAAILTLNKWGEESSTLMMRELLSLDGEVTFLHHLQGYPKATALLKLEDKRRQQQLGFFSHKTQEELEAAKRIIEGDEASYWMYQFSVLIFEASIEALQTLIKQVQQIFINYGISAAREMAALEYVWRSQLPGEQSFLRPTYVLSHNLSYLIPFDRIALGPPDCDWGAGPLRYMKTVSGESYRLNLHISDQKEALGHSLVIAPSGSGKTTLIQHLIAGALRHPDLRVFIFDRFNGTRIFTQACDGVYVDFKGREPIQLNPFVMPDTGNNRQTLRNLLTLMAGDTANLEEIERILNLIYSLPVEQRILKHNVSALLNRHNPSYQQLQRWFSGIYSPWFNGNQDQQAWDALDLRRNRLIGFEMTDIMNIPDIVAPLTYYLNQRIKDAVYDPVTHTAYPHWLFYDESAPMLANSFIREQMVKVDLQEARKRRGVVTLCFQSIQSLMDTGVSNIILDQCKTQFMFPNPNCNQETLQHYQHIFNLTDAETAFVSGNHPQAKRKPYSVLLKKPTESVILDCDLSSLGNYLKVYKSGTEFVAQVNQLQQAGDPWLQAYLN